MFMLPFIKQIQLDKMFVDFRFSAAKLPFPWQLSGKKASQRSAY